jgi:hypothetical protein
MKDRVVARYSRVDFVPLDGIEGPDAISGQFASIAPSDGQPHFSAEWSVLQRQLAAHTNPIPFAVQIPQGAAAQVEALAGEFMYYRLVNRDPAAYRRWRIERGGIRRSVAAMVADLAVPDGKTEDGALKMTFDDLFDAKWRDGEAAVLHGRPFPIKFGGGKGSSLAFGWADRADPFFALPSLSSDLIPTEGWNGWTSCSLRTWYERPCWDDLHSGKPGVGYLCCVFGTIVETQDGERVPLVLTFFFDPRAKRWSLELVNYFNVDARKDVPGHEV